MASEIKVDTVSEKTSANGITIDGLNIKDAKLATANSVVETNMSANSVDSDSYVDGSIDNAHIADDAIDSEHYAAGSIDTAHIADGQVTIGKLATAVLTGATDIGAAIVDADLLLVDDGAGGTLRKTAASRIKTYIGDNTPSFKVILTTAQAITHNTSTVIAYNTEIYDTDNAVSSGTFTVPSGKAGKYFFTAVGGINSSSDISNVTLGLSKETASSTTGTDGAFTFIEYYHKGSSAANTHRSVSATFDLAETDTVTVRIYQNVGSNQNTTEDNRTAFSGFKLL